MVVQRCTRKNTLSPKFWLYIVVVFGGVRGVFFIPRSLKGGGGGSRILPLLIYCKGCIDVWGRHQGRNSRKFMIPISECLSIHSNYILVLHIQELDRGLLLSKYVVCTVSKRFNAFGWADGQAIGWVAAGPGSHEANAAASVCRLPSVHAIQRVLEKCFTH